MAILARRCAKARCPKFAVLGSRCVRHWLYRQKAYRELPTHTQWWAQFEPILVEGIELRIAGLSDGPPVVVPPKQWGTEWKPQIEALIAAAEVARRRHAEHHHGNEAPGQ